MAKKTVAEERAELLAEWDRRFGTTPETRPSWLEALKNEGLRWHLDQAELLGATEDDVDPPPTVLP